MHKPVAVLGLLATAVVTGGIALTSSGSAKGLSAVPTSSRATAAVARPMLSRATVAVAAASRTEISTANVTGLGTILVNGEGRTLYIFVPDKHAKVTCLGECAEIWPPMFLSNGRKPVVGRKVKRSLLGSDPDPSVGQRVITYAGWPLYTYVSDSGPGSATGQAIDLNGGYWYVISPSGRVVKKRP